MKSQGWMRVAVAAAAMMVAAFGPVGCNDDDGGGSNELDGYFASHPFVTDPRTGGTGSGVVSVTPTAAQVNQVGGKAVFKASGGDGSYTWDVANTSVGSISASGAQAVYTALTIGNNDVIVFDGEGNAALAKISGTASAALAATADPVSLSPDFTFSTLKATGGQPPYTWASLDPGKGAVVGPNVGASVVYERLAQNDNVVTVTDALGATASVVILQP
jgi:hypothetical protein